MSCCCSPSVVQGLDECKGILTNELSKELPPVREVDHKIELVPETEQKNKALYRFNQTELVKLKRQLTELLARGYVLSNKLLFRTLMLFVSEKGGQLQMCINYRTLNRVTVKNNYSLL